MPRLILEVSDKVAENLNLDSSLQNISVVELLRRGAALAILKSGIEAEIKAYFPEGTALDYAFTITATAEDGSSKDFALTPNLEEIGGSHLSLIGEYPPE